MSEPYIAEIRTFSFGFAPKGWAQCNGALLQISQNQALFALIGTTYGGDGRTTFGLPDLRGRVPVHLGTDTSGNAYIMGQVGGVNTVALTSVQIPAHTHAAYGSTVAATSNAPGGSVLPGTLANAPGYATGTVSLVPMGAAAVNPAGGGGTHSNVQPFLTLNICICLSGIFPPRS